MEKITVLLSTYNGEKYLKKQIDSILSQKGCVPQIMVRDDGSIDSTIDILANYQNKGLLKWYKGENLKPARSFLKLLQDSPESNFYAFSDQDDCWLDNKLITAINKIKSSSLPALYFSQTQLTDSNLNPIETLKIDPYCSLGEALMIFYASGCTFVFNKKLRDIILEYTPSYVSMHDNWIYSVCLAIGGYVYFDKNSYIMYRQHSNNVIGLNDTFIKKQKKRISRLIEGRRERSNIAKELLRGYNKYLNKSNENLVFQAANVPESIICRIKLIFNKNFRCKSLKNNILSRIAVLLGVY